MKLDTVRAPAAGRRGLDSLLITYGGDQWPERRRRRSARLSEADVGMDSAGERNRNATGISAPLRVSACRTGLPGREHSSRQNTQRRPALGVGAYGCASTRRRVKRSKAVACRLLGDGVLVSRSSGGPTPAHASREP